MINGEYVVVESIVRGVSFSLGIKIPCEYACVPGLLVRKHGQIGLGPPIDTTCDRVHASRWILAYSTLVIVIAFIDDIIVGSRPPPRNIKLAAAAVAALFFFRVFIESFVTGRIHIRSFLRRGIGYFFSTKNTITFCAIFCFSCVFFPFVC